MEFYDKYIKYKTKYLNIKTGGSKNKKNKNKNKIIKNNNNMNRFHVSEPWFSLISLGIKTIEGRKNKGIFKELKIGDVIEWFNNDFNDREVKTKIIDKRVYKTFKEYLEKEGIEKTVPGQLNLEQGLNVYYKYYSEESVKDCGVVAIELELIK